MSASKPQPPPEPGKMVVADYVLQDIQERVAVGERKYGTKLQTSNGRDALMDLYQELIDAIFYLRQLILERDGVPDSSIPAWSDTGEHFLEYTDSHGRKRRVRE